MLKNRIITGLDVGTNSVKALSVVKRPDSLDLEVLGRVQAPVLGMRRGVVAKIEEVSAGINEALTELQNLTGQRIEDVYTNIGGNHINSISSRGTVAVSRADRKVSEEDVNRVIQAARAFSLPSNQEILDVFPREFVIDGQGQVKEVLGMQGIRLEVEILALCAFSPYFKNLTAAVLNAGFQIADIIPSPLAAARAVLDPRQKELGAAVLDIGSGTTGLAVYAEGDLIHLAIFPIGSSHITNDIAVGLKCDIDVAEKIKLEFGSCVQESGKKIDKINIPQEDVSLAFSHKALVEIIEARVFDIFDQVNKELKKLPPSLVLPAGIALTGGGAKLPKIVEFAKRELKLPVRLGFARGFVGLDKDPSLSAVCGLVLGGLDTDAVESFSPSGQGIAGKLKKVFKIFIP